jgi:hypothetical protein
MRSRSHARAICFPVALINDDQMVAIHDQMVAIHDQMVAIHDHDDQMVARASWTLAGSKRPIIQTRSTARSRPEARLDRDLSQTRSAARSIRWMIRSDLGEV